MSDPVSNAEVEDVLASIRRLVSGEKQPQGDAPSGLHPAASAGRQNADVPDAGQPAGDRSAGEGTERGKLVLTPALRVSDPVPESETVGDDPQEFAASDGSGRDMSDKPEAADAPLSGYDDGPDDMAAADARSAAELVGFAATESARDAKPLDHASLSPRADAPPVGDVSPFGEKPKDAQAPSPAPMPSAAPIRPEDRAGISAAPVDRSALSAAPAKRDGAPASDAFKAEAQDNPTSLSAKIAALEAVIGKRQESWEPDGVAQEDDYSGTEAPTLAWEDHIAEDTPPPAAPAVPEVLEAEEYDDDEGEDAADAPADAFDSAAQAQSVVPPQANPAPQLDDQDEDAPNGLDLSDETAILDEETLRDMVSEIVREELQGALGERITRNVRKLVRREIQRALAAQDLE